VWVLWLVAFLLFWLWACVLRGGSRLGGFFIVGHRRTLAVLALPIVGIAALPHCRIAPCYAAGALQEPGASCVALPVACSLPAAPIPNRGFSHPAMPLGATTDF